MMGWFQNLLSLMPRETQEVPTANALDYSSFRDLYGREPRMGEMPTGSAGPASYLAGQISGANVAGGAPGPRYGQMKISSNAPSWFQRAWRGGKRELPPQGPVPQRLPIQPSIKPPAPTYELPESSDELRSLLEQLGGTWRRPPSISGGAPSRKRIAKRPRRKPGKQEVFDVTEIQDREFPVPKKPPKIHKSVKDLLGSAETFDITDLIK